MLPPIGAGPLEEASFTQQGVLKRVKGKGLTDELGLLMQVGSLFYQFFQRALWLSDGFYLSAWSLTRLLAMPSEQSGYLHCPESYRCCGFYMMGEGTANNAFF